MSTGDGTSHVVAYGADKTSRVEFEGSAESAEIKVVDKKSAKIATLPK